jgi:tyrocidine synthetase-3
MIIKKFEEIVQRFPEKTALKTNNKSLTYAELNFCANRVAHALVQEDKGESTPINNQQVALLFDHGIDMVVGVIGTLKANKTYVPLDTFFPGKRLLYILEDCEADLILTDNKNHELAQELSDHAGKNISVLNIEAIGDEIPGTTFQRQPSEERTAYILYTSGSTGKPKGVYQIHRNVWYYTWNWIKRFSITETDRMSLFTSFCHDGSVQDMFAALLVGATSYPYFIKNTGNTDELYNLLIEEKLTIWHSVPTLYRFFVNTLSEKSVFNDIRWVLLGGEPLRPYDLDLIRTYFPRANLANVYGQTESSVSTICTVSPKGTFDDVHLGEPLDETQILLVTEEGNTVETIGVGEIVVACDYLAPGYWKDHQGTEEVFTHDEELGRLYWTGDLGRLTMDGYTKAMGRKDFQIKIRGFRVETGEIESVLMQHPLVEEAVILAKEDENDNNYLCAYIVSEAVITTLELKESLAAELPDYMIPRYFISLDEMPLTPNGKIDRNRLPEPEEAMTSEAEYESPANEIEEELVIIWQELMGTEKIGINTSFFDVGGHSLLAITLISQIHKTFGVELQLNDVFNNPTIKGLSHLVMGSKPTVFSSIEPVEKREYYDVSPDQLRLFLLNLFEGIGVTYNLFNIMKVEGDVDRYRFQEAFRELIKRHESLRTSFEMRDEKLIQRIHEDLDSQLMYVDVRKDRQGNDDINEIIRDLIKPFDLSKAPLIRVSLINMLDNSHLLIMDYHHIATDGAAELILIHEFSRLYAGEKLPGLRLNYKDYSQWQNNFQDTDSFKRQEQYWLNIYSGDIPVLNLPNDYPRPQVQSFQGSGVGFVLEEEIVKELYLIVKETGATLFMVLLAMYNVLLHKYTNQEDIIVGSIFAGRNHTDLENIVGFFAKTLALRNYPTPQKPFDLFLEELKQNTLKAFENQVYPFGQLVEKLKLSKDRTRNPLFDTLFVLQNTQMQMSSAGQSSNDVGITITPTKFEIQTTRFDIYFEAVESAGKIFCVFQYNTTLFKKETIELMKEHFLILIQDILNNSKVKIQDLEFATPFEKEMDEFQEVEFDL